MRQVARVVSTGFWEDPMVTNDFSPEDKYFMLYLLTNPHTTQLGIYKLVPKVAAFEMGYSVEAVLVLIERFERKYDIVKYSKETSEIAIKNFLKHSVIKGGKPVMDCLLKEEKDVKDKSLLAYIHDSINNVDTLNITVKEYLNHIRINNNNDNDNDNENENERIVACDFLRLKDMVVQNAPHLPDDGEYVCEWCGNKVSALEKHHFPLPRSLNGKRTVSICKKCHTAFHALEYGEKLGEYSAGDKKKTNASEADSVFETLWKMYPRKLGKGSIKQATKRRICDIGFETMKKCIERYKETIVGKDEQYVMYGSTFFNSGYVDFLDENFIQEESKPTEPEPEEPEESIDLETCSDEEYFDWKERYALRNQRV